MRTHSTTIIILFFVTLFSCDNSSKADKAIKSSEKEKIFAKEPDDSFDYKYLKYNFYQNEDGQLFEKKLVPARDTTCKCDFEVYYDSSFSFYNDDTVIKKPLNSIIDINSFIWFDSTEFSKDKKRVYYFHGNSDGGTRFIVDKADPGTFKRLCEYRWGIDKNYVFYETEILQEINLKYLQVLYPPDTSDHFVQYVKDDKNVYYKYEIVIGADAKTFKVISGQKWEAEDKNYKYETGRRQE